MPTLASSVPSPSTLALLLLGAGPLLAGCSGGDPATATDTADTSSSGGSTGVETSTGPAPTTSTTAEPDPTSGTTSEPDTTSGATSEPDTTSGTTSEPDTTGTTEAPCPEGTLGCPCSMGQVCVDALVCDAGVCAEPTAGGCGDGVVDPGEACDAGRDNGPGKACKGDCTLNVCGDGDVGPGELCDDGNRQDDDACSNTCTLASCGDGVVQQGEACDDGDADDTDACTTACTPAACGDGIVQPVAGETCDAGPDNGPGKACKGDCTLNVCGDGDVGPGEACDGGEGCNDCQLDTCGDGVVDPGEACDDGNQVEHDGCTSACAEGQVHGLTVAQYASCAMLDGGAVRCWGRGSLGSLGYANTLNIGDDEHPNAAGPVKLGGPAVEVEAGDHFVCARMASGDLRCWGKNDKGQLGLGHTETIGDDEHPEVAPPVQLGGTAVQLSSQYEHTCALLEGGEVRCWGAGVHGDLGLGTFVLAIGDDDHPAEFPPVQLGGKALAVSCGMYFSCALLEGGAVRCWGLNLAGQLGLGHTEVIGDGEHPDSEPPVQLGGKAVQVMTGLRHACALLEGGDVRCWGGNASGAAGYPGVFYIGDDEHPADLPPVQLGGKAVAIAGGGHNSCALLESGDLRCWGPSAGGQLGYGDTETIGDDEHPSAAGPVMLGGDTPMLLAVGAAHTCVFTTGGALRCWGSAVYGRLGYGNTEHIGDDEHPIAVGPVQIF